MSRLGLGGILVVIALFFWLVSSPDSFGTVFAAGGEALGKIIVGGLGLLGDALPQPEVTPVPERQR